MSRMKLAVVAALLVYSVAMRLLPYALYRFFGMEIDPQTTTYPWNFSPLPAICLFGGACFADRRWAYAVPLAAFLVGDLGIWALTEKLEFAVYRSQPVVYTGMLLTVWVGSWLTARRTLPAVLGAGFAASVLFYLITNFAVWALGEGSHYPHTAAGLLDCYVRALPFFRNSVISMAVFSVVLFSPLVVRSLESGEEPAQRGTLAES